jgi:glycerol-3-phosphate acyltransferase PlsY
MAALSIGYLLGSLNSSLIVARAYGVEIRTLGSKSAGLTNALRVLGKGAAVFVLVGDILKGVVACLIGLWIGVYVQAGDAVDCVSLLAAAAGAVIGHNWPVYFNFVGGKGALTAAAVMFMINCAFFIFVVAATRYVSLGTILACTFFVIISLLPVFGNTIYFHATSFTLALIIVIKHRENVKRLLSGKENKLNLGSRGSASRKT